jgi:hypothetical protein
MALVDFPIRPGVYSDFPDRGVGKLGFWKGSDKVRFVESLPETIGGWVADNPAAAMQGKARGVVDWVSLRGERIIAFGTHLKLYVWLGGQFFDITPVRASSTINADPFATTDTLATVTVTDTAHGAADGAFVTFSGAAAVGGITIAGEYQITYVDSNSYTITHSAVATSSATGGGASVVATYQIDPGSGDSGLNFGWGAGAWAADTWGTARLLGIPVVARTWALGTWGEDLIASHADGSIYVWDSSGGVGTVATLITQAPTSNKSVFISQAARHMIALGADADPMLIRWCSSEDYTVWTPTTTNTAGDKRLDKGSSLVRGIEYRNQHLVFTNAALYLMQYIGPPYIFSVEGAGLNGGVVGPNAMAVYADICYWMGSRNFYQYDGTIKPIPCHVQEAVFNDFNPAQKAKVWAAANAQFDEIWWFYCSANSTEMDRYVIYNTTDKNWSVGTLARTLFVGDSDIVGYPYAVSLDGLLYYHEFGTDADGAAISAYVESGDVEIPQSGEMMMHVSKMIPSFKRVTGDATITVTTKKYPQSSETQASGPLTVNATTEFINPRVRGRQMAVKIASNAADASWRAGILRLDLKPHGRR